MPRTEEVRPFCTRQIAKPFDLKPNPHDTWPGFEIDEHIDTELLHLGSVTEAAILRLESGICSVGLYEDDSKSLDEPYISQSLHSPSTSASAYQSSEDGAQDLWDPNVALDAKPTSIARDWDLFQDAVDRRFVQSYLSEAAPETVDVLVSGVWDTKNAQPLKYIKLDGFEHSVSSLILGRASSLFLWDQLDATFRVKVDDLTVTGFTPAFCQALFHALIQHGTLMRRLRDFCRSVKVSLTTTALRASIVDVLQSIEQYIVSRDDTTTLSKLYIFVQQCSGLLCLLQQLVDCIQPHECEMNAFTQMIETLAAAWVSNLEWRATTVQLLTNITAPALRELSQLHLVVAARNTRSSDLLLWRLLPNLRQTLDEAFNYAYRLDRDTIAGCAPVDTHAADLKLATTWTAVHHRNLDLENGKHILMDQAHSSRDKKDHSLLLENMVSQNDLHTCRPFDIDFNSTLASSSLLTNGNTTLARSVVATFENDAHEDSFELPPLQAIELSIVPQVESWHQNLSAILTRKILIEHNLRRFVDELSSCYLLQNGQFVGRLSQALFAKHINGADYYHQGRVRAGLALDSRTSWPPTSTELRLSLMGVLTDPDISRVRELDCLSFATKDLSEDDLHDAHDRQSLHALDFLRLICKSPDPVLDLVVDSTSIGLYENIFQFLLITLRMHALAQRLQDEYRANVHRRKDVPAHFVRFYVEFRHVASVLLDFVLNIAIAIPLSKWSQYVLQLQTAYNSRQVQDLASVTTTPVTLHAAHQEMLETIATSLLLGTGEVEVYDLLRKILALFLEIAYSISRMEDAKALKVLCSQVKPNIKIWLAQVKELAKSDNPALQRLEVLHTQLTLSEYYVNG